LELFSRSPMLALFALGLLGMLSGGWMTWSAQTTVDGGAGWDEAPAWWAGEIQVGGKSRNGVRRAGTTIMNTNGEHWAVGLVLAGVGALFMLGAAVGSVGLSGTPGFSAPEPSSRDDFPGPPHR
jgi:hypothetical protein